MNAYTFFCCAAILMFLFMAGSWAVDIGASGAIISAGGTEVVAEGLLGYRSAVVQYHLGMVLQVMSFTILLILSAYVFFSARGDIAGKNRK